jgi:hypothetical protein
MCPFEDPCSVWGQERSHRGAQREREVCRTRGTDVVCASCVVVNERHHLAARAVAHQLHAQGHSQPRTAAQISGGAAPQILPLSATLHALSVRLPACLPARKEGGGGRGDLSLCTYLHEGCVHLRLRARVGAQQQQHTRCVTVTLPLLLAAAAPCPTQAGRSGAIVSVGRGDRWAAGQRGDRCAHSARARRW